MFEGLFQPMHLLVIIVILLLFFGPKKLGDLGKGLGEGIRGFKKALHDEPENTQTTAKPAVTAGENKPSEPAH